MSITLKVTVDYDLECDHPGCDATLHVGWEYGDPNHQRFVVEAERTGWLVLGFTPPARLCYCPAHRSKP